jgi:hypothetical protein
MVISRERPSADHIAADNFMKTFEMLTNLPQKNLTSNQEKTVSGIKFAKESVTVAACSNASGTLKHPLFCEGHPVSQGLLKT